jgi:hypothetical protein
MGTSALALAIAAHRGLPGSSIAGPAFTGLWGLAWLLSVFPIERQPHSFSGYAHGVAFVLLSLVAIPMLLFMWRRLRQAPGWESIARYSLIMGVLTFPLEFASIPLQMSVPFPWLYLWLASLLIWCVLLGVRLWRVQESTLNLLTTPGSP